MAFPKAGKGPSPAKAKQMLKDDSAQGKPLSAAQKGLFGAIAGGTSTTKPPPAKQATKPTSPGSKGLAIGERPVAPKAAAKYAKMAKGRA